MRTRAGLGLLTCCCAALTACTAAAPTGPDTSVTTPAVGRPPAPASAKAAVSSEAFTSYAALGLSSNDGLAPGKSFSTFAAACMTAAGYPSAGSSSVMASIGVTIWGGLLAVGSPWGGWGYLGATDAQQYGFIPPSSALSALGFGAGPSSSASLSPPEQAAAGKCTTIEQDLVHPVEDGPLAGITTLGNDILTDVGQDPAVQTATRAWSACMAKNGYSFPQPLAVYPKERPPVNTSAPVSAAANQAQLATAVTDADCTQSSDLAGIYFAVQASYEQQLVTANQQALAAAVTQYRADYNKALTNLAAQLRTTKAQPFPHARPPAPRRSNAG
jgi:hypothetical protein